MLSFIGIYVRTDGQANGQTVYLVVEVNKYNLKRTTTITAATTKAEAITSNSNSRDYKLQKHYIQCM